MREILELLERDAQLSHDTLATMTGLPVEQVAAQVAAWEASGVIRRYTAIVDSFCDTKSEIARIVRPVTVQRRSCPPETR